MTSRTTPRRRVVAVAAAGFAVACASLVPGCSPGSEPADRQGARVLAATAVHPTGGDVRTVFVADRVAPAEAGWQGVATGLPPAPTSRPGATPVPGPMLWDGQQVTTPSAPASTGSVPYQRFDLDWRGAGQQVVWSGSVDRARTVVLSVWDGDRWQRLAQSRGLGDDLLTLQAPLRPQHSTDGTVHVLVHASDPFADDIAHEVRPDLDDPSGFDFTLVHQSDTQYLTNGAATAATAAERDVWARGLTDANQWIADNAQYRRIAFVAHTGDLAENWLDAEDRADVATAQREFTLASAAQRTIEASGVVTATLPGNHDNQHGSDTGASTLYNRHFGPERQRALARSSAWQRADATYAPWRPGDASNSVTTFSAGGLDFVAVSLGFGVTAEEAAWASARFREHAGRNGILLTHDHTAPSRRRTGRGGRLSAEGAFLRAEVVAPHPNVALVLSGHHSGVAVNVHRNLGRPGHHVVEMLADYQSYTSPARELGLDRTAGIDPDEHLRLGASFLRLLQVDVDRSEISVDTYSPALGKVGAGSHDRRNRYDGRADDFRVPVQLTSRTTSFSTDALFSVAPGTAEIGSVVSPSGSRATVPWDGLPPGDVHGWHSTQVDAATGATLPGSARSGWFVARAGADQRAPQLSVPGSSTVGHGSRFRPMRGVRARDDDGTDLTGSVAVTGRVDTSRAGAHLLTYAATDAAGNTTTRTRRVVVAEAPTGAGTVLHRR